MRNNTWSSRTYWVGVVHDGPLLFFYSWETCSTNSVLGFPRFFSTVLPVLQSDAARFFLNSANRAAFLCTDHICSWRSSCKATKHLQPSSQGCAEKHENISTSTSGREEWGRIWGSPQVGDEGVQQVDTSHVLVIDGDDWRAWYFTPLFFLAIVSWCTYSRLCSNEGGE